MERLSKSAIAEFLARRPFSVVHIDADWDGYRKAVADRICTIEPQFDQTVSFGYVDCDAELEYVGEIGIRNVPSVAYYAGTRLFGIVIGLQQDVASNIERLMRGEPLDQTNVLSRG
jgi:hypothetical protein